MRGQPARPAPRWLGWLGGLAGVAGALSVGLAGSRLRTRPPGPGPGAPPTRRRLRPQRGVALAVGALGVLAVVRLPGAVLVWLALSGSVHLPLIRRRGATVPLGSAALSGMLLAWVGRGLVRRDVTVAVSQLNRPLVVLAMTTAASGLRGILAPDPEVLGLRRHLAVQVHATALPLLSVGAALLVGNQLGTPGRLRWLRRVVLGVGGLQLVKELRLLPRAWPFPPWNDLLLGHATSLATASALFGAGRAGTRLATGAAVVGAWTRAVLLNLLRPNERQWISGWIAMTLPPALLLLARFPRRALLAWPLAVPTLLVGPARLAGVWRAARAKGDLDRLVIWRDAWRLACRRPVLGVGPGNYPDHARRYYTAYAATPAPARVWTAGIVAAHANYPQLAVDTGFAGLGAAAWVLAEAMATSRRLVRTVEDPFLKSLAAGIGASLAGQAATGILSDTLLPSYHNGGHVKISSTVYTWALIGGLIAIETSRPPAVGDGSRAGSDVPRRLPARALGGLALAVAGACLALGGAETLWERRATRRVRRRDREEDLARRLRARLERFRGDVGIYAKDMASGVTYEHRASELFPVSSVFKVFVLLHVFRRHEAGALALTERRPVPAEGISRLGPGVLKHLRGQPTLSVLDHCRLMTVWSDNVATDVLMQSERPAAVNATLRSLGLRTSRVAGTCTEMVYRMAGWDPATVSPASEREVGRRLARAELVAAGFADRSLDGTVSTPRELGALYERLLRGELVGGDGTARILGLLEDASAVSRSMIPRFLPDGMPIAHRAGGSWRVLADAGIVDVRGRPIVLALCAYHHPEEIGAADLLADVSRMLFEWFRAPAHRAARD